MVCMIICKHGNVCALVCMHVCVVNYVNVSEGVCKSGCSRSGVLRIEIKRPLLFLEPQELSSSLSLGS